jgi:hypothetical protein
MPGEVKVVTIIATARSAGLFNNTAEVTTNNEDEDKSNNRASAQVRVLVSLSCVLKASMW